MSVEYDDLDVDYPLEDVSLELRLYEEVDHDIREELESMVEDLGFNYTEREDAPHTNDEKPVLKIYRPGIIGSEQLSGEDISAERVIAVLEE